MRCSQPQLALCLPLVFSAEKTAISNAPRTKAAVRGAALRGFAKQTEKGAWKRGESLLFQTIPNPFSYRLPRQKRSQLSTQTQVLWYFLDARKYRSPLPRVFPYTSSLPSHSFTFGTSSSFATVGAISRMDVPCSSLPSANFGPQIHTGIVISSGVSVPWLRSWPP